MYNSNEVRMKVVSSWGGTMDKLLLGWRSGICRTKCDIFKNVKMLGWKGDGFNEKSKIV